MTQTMARLKSGYHTICRKCAGDFHASSENLDMHMRRHGAPDAVSCANCGKMKHSTDLTTYRVWYATAK